tara:strand:+ start:32 stop:463 length:432 start_codon:yes stop_codon:yes gene_type:complete
MAQRKRFAGGGKDASTKSFDAPAAKRENREPIGREDRVSQGATQFQSDNQGFTPAQVANQNAGNVSGSDYTDSKKAFNVSVYQPKEIPAYVPGGMYAKALRKIVGTPFTKMGKTLTAQQRMARINSLPPRERKAMIDRLGLAQ